MKCVVDISENRLEVLRMFYKDCQENLSTSDIAIVEGKPLDDVFDEIRAEIKPKCDRINSLASVLPYTAHREIQELLCEIMNLCKAESEDKE